MPMRPGAARGAGLTAPPTAPSAPTLLVLNTCVGAAERRGFASSGASLPLRPLVDAGRDRTLLVMGALSTVICPALRARFPYVNAFLPPPM